MSLDLSVAFIMENFEAHRMKCKITMHQNMSNFEALHWVISSSIKLLFLKSDILHKNDGPEYITIIILKQT